MNLDVTTIVAIVSTLGTFIAAVSGALMAWSKGNQEEKARFRDDMFKLNDALRKDITELRVRIGQLEVENDKANHELSQMGTTIEKIRAALYNVHGIDLDDVLSAYKAKMKGNLK